MVVGVRGAERSTSGPELGGFVLPLGHRLIADASARKGEARGVDLAIRSHEERLRFRTRGSTICPVFRDVSVALLGALLLVSCAHGYSSGHIAVTGESVDGNLTFEFVRCGSRPRRKSVVRSITVNKVTPGGEWTPVCFMHLEASTTGIRTEWTLGETPTGYVPRIACSRHLPPGIYGLEVGAGWSNRTRAHGGREFEITAAGEIKWLGVDSCANPAW